eukprot:6182699-Pleurochrysis_carterae.AAC.2
MCACARVRALACVRSRACARVRALVCVRLFACALAHSGCAKVLAHARLHGRGPVRSRASCRAHKSATCPARRASAGGRAAHVTLLLRAHGRGWNRACPEHTEQLRQART